MSFPVLIPFLGRSEAVNEKNLVGLSGLFHSLNIEAEVAVLPSSVGDSRDCFHGSGRKESDLRCGYAKRHGIQMLEVGVEFFLEPSDLCRTVEGGIESEEAKNNLRVQV